MPQSSDPSSTTNRNTSGANKSRRVPVWPFMLWDAVLINIFAIVGRASHGEGAAAALTTAWPFLVGALVGWLISRGWRQPHVIVPTGLIVWASTVIGGMALRVLIGAGTHWSFIIVAAIANAIFLLGYRLIFKPVIKREHSA